MTIWELTMTMVTIEQMVTKINRIIEMLAAVPEDQRTTVMQRLLADLQLALEHYDEKDA